MSKRKVSGTDVILKVDLTGGTSYEVVVCLTKNSFSLAVDKIDAKSKCGPDTLPGSETFNVSFDGQVIYSPGTGETGIAALYTAAVNKTTIGWSMGKATPITGDVIYSGTAFISKLDQDYSDGSPGTFAGELGVFGTPTQVITL